MAMTERDTEMLTIAEAATLLKVGRSTINRWLRDGRLPAYRVGPKAVRIRRDDLTRVPAPLPKEVVTPIMEPQPISIHPLTDDDAAQQQAAYEASKAHLARMRARCGGKAVVESWRLIREGREERGRRL